VSGILDNLQFLKEKDPHGALEVASYQYTQVLFDAKVQNPEHDGRKVTNIVVTGMGGSALAAVLAKVWLRDSISIPFEVVRGYELPHYVDEHTLVIASSYSGNTEETVATLKEAHEIGAQVCIIASGGRLEKFASEYSIAYIALPVGLQPRMAVIYNLRAIVRFFELFGFVEDKYSELESLSSWLGNESVAWGPHSPTDNNLAKQIAMSAVGKTPVFYGGALTAPVAYKWKISWNETAKNTAFWNEFPEFNHNEFMGWVSHPVEKPFAVYDLRSSFEHPQIQKRFDISDRLLSGKRPKSTSINLSGDTLLAQLLWGSILADFASIYVAILNGVDPVPVELIERLKLELK
jgi:glucose/mannose-6-phosphate isomerase